MAGLRRIGLTHPLDSKPLTVEAGDGYPPHVLIPAAARTEKKVREFLHSKGWPLKIRVAELNAVVSHATAEKVLYQLGYRIGGKVKGRGGAANQWVANAEITGWHEELLKHHPVNATPNVEVKLREPEPVCQHAAWEDIGGSRKCSDCGEDIGPILVRRDEAFDTGPIPDLGLEPVEHVDFIDERDSWVVDMTELFGDVIMRIMADRLKVLEVVGMDYEFRVWRKKEQ